jgi:hypothetical protein
MKPGGYHVIKRTLLGLALALLAPSLNLIPLVLLAQTPTKPTAPDWVIPGATIEMDFEHNRYYGASLDDVKNENATVGYAQNKSGLLEKFEPNKLRRTDLGLLIESAQYNELLWSRDLTKNVWVKTNIKAEPAPVGADGVEGRGTRLTALADNAAIVQTVKNINRTSYDRDKKGNQLPATGEHGQFYLKRVAGTGEVRITLASATGKGKRVVPATLLNANGYTQINGLRFQAGPDVTYGIELATAGDVVDVDMATIDVECARNIVASPSPFPNQDKLLWRESDMVTVSPSSPLYKALAGKAGTVYVKTFNLQGVEMAFYRFASPTHSRMFGVTANFCTSFIDGPTRVFLNGKGNIGSGKEGTYSWLKHHTPHGPVSMLRDGVTVRSVATWGGGKASVVANNGPVATGGCTETEANGVLYLGLTTNLGKSTGKIVNTDHPNVFHCDGFIQDIAFIPEVVEGYGAKLTVGPDGPPTPQGAVTQPK